ncbi:hypothetical protein NUU61_008076 [Penicillium alfredii]|uniref:HpcH/HpaI aldolase/citrate lyase domain-containing protein n=1 Tax=Penicillium alfredii TaxID=1506179 RepID=A0A9W9ES01_9EURO|nr:uncharacterized protein NUU61_008076 [Penicillium alfredii]KAJ5086769.1 hypothetical protein NUU61_008076 [Penicillium alfredii]
MAARNTLRRSFLYVPGSSQRFLDKSRSLTADCVAYDLEDSVTPHMKAEARSPRAESYRPARAIGDPGTGINSASDVTFVTDVVNHTLAQQQQQSSSGPSTRPPISLIALIETAKSLTNLTEICKASPLLQGLVFAAEDFALDLSITRTPSLTEFLFARSAIATAARAANLPSTIDLVCTAYKSDKADGSPPAALEEECRDGRRLGFNGKQCIHPSQAKTADAIFGPQAEETLWAMRVVIADEKAAAAGRGAWTLDGKMIDVPVAQKARAIVKKAEACGVDVAALREQWQHQEPE